MLKGGNDLDKIKFYKDIAETYKDSYLNLIKNTASNVDVDDEFYLTDDFIRKYCVLLYALYEIKFRLKKGRIDTTSFFVQDLLAEYIKKKLNQRTDGIEVLIDYSIKCHSPDKTTTLQPDIIILKKDGDNDNKANLVGLVEIKTNRGYSRDTWYLNFNKKREIVKNESDYLSLSQNKGWVWPSNWYPHNYEKIYLPKNLEEKKIIFSVILSAGNMMGRFKPLKDYHEYIFEIYNNIIESGIFFDEKNYDPIFKRLDREYKELEKKEKNNLTKDKKREYNKKIKSKKIIKQIILENSWKKFEECVRRRDFSISDIKEIMNHDSDGEIIFLWDEEKNNKFEFDSYDVFYDKFLKGNPPLYSKNKKNSVEYLINMLKMNI